MDFEPNSQAARAVYGQRHSARLQPGSGRRAERGRQGGLEGGQRTVPKGPSANARACKGVRSRP